MMIPEGYIPYQKIAEQLDVQKGDTLVLAADITRLAIQASKYEGSFDINLFIESFMEKIGKQGTLLLQAFNHDLPPGSCFDIRNTKPRTGALALAAFERKDFVRTHHPLHSFMVWGKYAGFFEDLSNSSSFAYDSPFAFFKDKEAKMIFVSSSVSKALTYTHYVEEAEKVKYRKYKSLLIDYVDKDGNKSRREYSIYAKKRGWTLDFAPLEEKMKKDGVLEETEINGMRIQLLPLDEAFYLIREDIRNNKARSIAFFSLKSYIKDMLKDYLYKIRKYRTTADKIKYGSSLL